MKKEKQQHNIRFYAELPIKQTETPDYPADIKIVNAYDVPRQPVLSEDEVSALARELLQEAKESLQDQPSSQNQPSSA